MITRPNWDLNEMPYQEFGKLRFLDFFPKIDRYFVDKDGCVEIPGLPLACIEGSLDTHFAWEPRSTDTAIIALDFEHDCPEAEGQALLERLGLNIHKGMHYEEIKRVLGSPAKDFGPPSSLGGSTEIQYVVGPAWPYYVNYFITETEGLSRVWIARKDLVDRYEDWESRL